MIVLISLKVTLVALSEWSPNTYVYHAGHTSWHRNTGLSMYCQFPCLDLNSLLSTFINGLYPLSLPVAFLLSRSWSTFYFQVLQDTCVHMHTHKYTFIHTNFTVEFMKCMRLNNTSSWMDSTTARHIKTFSKFHFYLCLWNEVPNELRSLVESHCMWLMGLWNSAPS